MEVKVKLRDIAIKDTETGEEITVRTLRSAQEIAGYVEESEKDEIVERLEELLTEIYNDCRTRAPKGS